MEISTFDEWLTDISQKIKHGKNRDSLLLILEQEDNTRYLDNSSG